MGPIEAVDWDRLQTLNSKLVTREMQLQVILSVLQNEELPNFFLARFLIHGGSLNIM